MFANSAAFLAALLLSCAAFAQAAVGQPGAATQPAALRVGDQFRHLMVDGRDRSYLVHVPPRFDAKRRTPVVLIFHGAGMNARMMAGFCGMSDKSDSAGFIAVYPNGTGIGETMLTFNAWELPAFASRRQPDDVAFTAKILDDLETVMKIDPNRVYATGMSNGGFMCYRLAAEMSDRIAAIAPVAGTLAVSQCNPKRPISVIHFHGTMDTFVPFAGANGTVRRFISFKSVDETIGLFVKHNGCPEQPKVTDLPDKANDGTKVTRRVYGPGKEGAEVVLYIIDGGGHTWPGRPAIVEFIGRSTQDINANDLIWDFFVKHPMTPAADGR